MSQMLHFPNAAAPEVLVLAGPGGLRVMDSHQENDARVGLCPPSPGESLNPTERPDGSRAGDAGTETPRASIGGGPQ